MSTSLERLLLCFGVLDGLYQAYVHLWYSHPWSYFDLNKSFSPKWLLVLSCVLAWDVI